jgi:S-formylglutathione hydrolase
MSAATSIETRAEHLCFGGRLGFYVHRSRSTASEMRFAVFEPPQARHGRLPALYYLAGLTCTEETFFIKSGAPRLAAERGLLVVACDTSPRGVNLPGDSESWDFGVGAGFYVDATEEPWSRHYRMATYVSTELPALVEELFPADLGRRGIFGHSMGGHGAIVTALREPERWRSLSAFAPIANPCAVPWGEKAFTGYLGEERAAWKEWDASELLRRRRFPAPILVDQGEADAFLTTQLHPEALEAAAAFSGQELRLRRHAGYDHSYWFIQTFLADHFAHHAAALL